MTEYANELVGIIYRGSGVNLKTAERLAKKIEEAGYVKKATDQTPPSLEQAPYVYEPFKAKKAVREQLASCEEQLKAKREEIAQRLSAGRKRDWAIEDYRKQADQIIDTILEEKDENTREV